MEPILAELLLSLSCISTNMDFQPLLRNPLNHAAIMGFESPVLPNPPQELVDLLPSLSYYTLVLLHINLR